MAISNYEIGSQSVTSTPTVTADRPLSLSDMGVNTGLTLKAIERKLQIESTLDDPIVKNMANVVAVHGQKNSVPDAVYLKVKAQAVGTRQTTIPFLKTFAGAVRKGNAQQQKGYEREFYLKYLTLYYNEYSQGIAGAEWGVDANDVAQFNLYAQIQPSLSKYFAEFKGKRVREALLRKYDEVLTAAPVSATQHWNKNWFIANTNFGSQPTYDSTESDFRSNISTALAAAATGTSGVNANIDIDYLLALSHYAQNKKRIEKINGMYIVLIPSTQMSILLSLVDGQAGGLWKDVSALSKEEAMYPGVVGKIKDLLIVEDPRYPTLVDSAGTFTVEYVNPGNTDSRNTSVYNSSTNKAWDIGYLLGKAAVAEWMVRPLHFEMEETEYGKIYGRAAFAEDGIQLVEYDVDSATDTSRENYGSCVLAFSSPNIVTTA